MQIKRGRVRMAMPSTGVIVARSIVGMAEVTSANRGVGEGAELIKSKLSIPAGSCFFIDPAP